MYLFDMTDAQINAAVEAYWDRRCEELNAPDAWEVEEPDWVQIMDIIDSQSDHQIADYVRDYIEDNLDLLCELADNGEIDEYIPAEDAWMMKDPDDKEKLVDHVFEKEWNNDKLMLNIWRNLSDKHTQELVEEVMENADDNGIREKYNERRREY